MKTQYFMLSIPALFTLPTSNASTFETLFQEIESTLQAEMDNNPKNPFTAFQTGPMLRNFKDMSYQADQIHKIENYGCWCYFYDNHGPGKAEPVDEIDASCKILHHGYECMMIDAVDEQTSSSGYNDPEGDCTSPWDVSYNKINPTGLSPSEIVDSCFSENSHSHCAARACGIETTFIQNIVNLFWWEDVIPDENYAHDNGFDPDMSCIPTPGLPPSEVTCCGEYPNRFAYKTLDGDRGCCNGRTYMTVFKECCDGQVKTAC